MAALADFRRALLRSAWAAPAARIDLYRRVSCSKLAVEREGVGAVREPPWVRMSPSHEVDSEHRAGARRHRRTIVLAALAAGVIALLPFCFFTVDRAEYAVVTQFGEPVQVVTAPGLGVKLPYQSVNRFDNRLFVYAPPLSEFLTLEKSAVVAASAILWRIAEPRKFFETVFDRVGCRGPAERYPVRRAGRCDRAQSADRLRLGRAGRIPGRGGAREGDPDAQRHGAARLRHRAGRRPAAALRFPGAQPARGSMPG